MPGHVKLGASNEPDPDPLPYLVVPMDVKRADMSKPYDSKKSVWVPSEDGGFKEAMLDSESGGKTTCMVGHEVTCLSCTCTSICIMIYYDVLFTANFRKKFSRVSWSVKSIHQNLKNAMTWPI